MSRPSPPIATTPAKARKAARRGSQPRPRITATATGPMNSIETAGPRGKYAIDSKNVMFMVINAKPKHADSTRSLALRPTRQGRRQAHKIIPAMKTRIHATAPGWTDPKIRTATAAPLYALSAAPTIRMGAGTRERSARRWESTPPLCHRVRDKL